MSGQSEDRAAHVAARTADLQAAMERVSGKLPDPEGCTQLAILTLCDLKGMLGEAMYGRLCELMALSLRGISLEFTLHQQQHQQSGRTVTETIEDSASGTDSPPTAH